MDRRARLACAAWLAWAACSGCTSFSHTNEPLATPRAADAPRLRNTFSVDGQRGNPRVLMFLSLSGGGSRAAYFSAATMLKLQTVFPDVDLLDEVDVMSSVSGGSLTAALYAATRDTSVAALAADPAPLLADRALAAKLRFDPDSRRWRCSAPLDGAESARLATLTPADARRLDTLCRQATLKQLKPWEDDTVRTLTRRNYLSRWIGNWFWPTNIARYWFTAYDRADIMAETLADNLYSGGFLGGPLRMDELNPTRPFLLVNATTAAAQDAPGIVAADEYAFGSVFTFTEEDFRERLNADAGRYAVARAVMASSSFPLVFPSQTLRDYRPGAMQTYCQDDREGQLKCSDRQYLHVFDGGNSDNLGLKSIKRALFQMEAEGRLQAYDRIVVLLVDAFTRPPGASRLEADPRGAIGMVLDMNVSDAVDSLLQTNRAKLVGEFDSGRLRWTDGDCRAESRELPGALCTALQQREAQNLNLTKRLVFYHFGFDDLVALDPGYGRLKREIDKIPTSFKLEAMDAALLDQAVAAVITPHNPCLMQLRSLVLSQGTSPEQVMEAREACLHTEGRRRSAVP